MPDFGYINAVINPNDIAFFQKLVRNICKPDDLFYSDKIGYIKGNVSADLHLTIFYGLISQKINKNKLNKYLKNIRIKTLTLGKILLMPGYKNEYQILYVEVLDKKKGLAKIAETFKQFPYEKSVQFPEFIPHLTLAYVKPSFKLPHLPDFPRTIKVKAVKFFEK